MDIGTGNGAGSGGARRDRLDEAVEELCGAVFPSLRRRDQRERGRQYVRGLITVAGRKSIRNMAHQTGGGGPAEEQALHHFIAGSTWEWEPIRAALTRYLTRTAPLNAWVVQPMAIPRGGAHSAGVGNRFDPYQGQMFQGQQSFGTWFTSGGVATPVGWRMHREHDADESYESCALTGVTEIARSAGAGVRPVVLDVPDIATRATVVRFAQARVPLVARVGAGALMIPADARRAGSGAVPMGARDVLQSVRGLRAPLEWADPDRPGARRSSLVAGVRVWFAGREMLLFGEWTDARRQPVQAWMTDLTRAAPAALLRMTKETGRVSRAAGTSLGRVGLRDFTGRSPAGWHRHVTLASIAHAALWQAGTLTPPPTPTNRPTPRPRCPSPC